MIVTHLAIVIPYYRITYFHETLESLVTQTDQRFKVYIGNDASPENPEELLSKFDGQFNFNYKKFEQNLGSVSLTSHWDRCLDLMQDEEWFLILGDDDYLSDNFVKEFYKNLEIALQENIAVIKANSAVVNEEGDILSEKKIEPFIKSSIEHFFDKYIHEGRSSLSEHIFKKSAYEKIGFKNLPFAWHSDDLALLQFSEFGNILFLQDAKCFVRLSSESISGNPDKNKKEKWQASKIFFDTICQNLYHFNPRQKVKLFDLIEWQESEKSIKITIPNKINEFYKTFGWRGIFKSSSWK